MDLRQSASAKVTAEESRESDLLGGIEIYVGAPIEYESERKTLDVVAGTLSSVESVLIFANFSVGSRQIDILVAKENLLVVIEVKGVSRAIRSSPNGPWNLALATGKWKQVRNPYEQALAGKFAVKDLMEQLGGGADHYPDAAVVFVPELPAGSQVSEGDYKVSLVELAGLPDLITNGRGGTWSLKRIRSMATQLRLRRVSSAREASDIALAQAGTLIDSYVREFEAMYVAPEKMESFDCQRADGQIVSSSDIRRLVIQNGEDFLVLGGSGLGKSMLAGRCGAEFNDHGGVALMLPVKDFRGDIKSVLNQEARLLGAPSAAALLGSAQRLGRPRLIVVDGYNECALDLRAPLTRRVAALARLYEAQILITSRSSLDRQDLLALDQVDVPATSLDTKKAIAKNTLDSTSMSEEMVRLLDSVSSGLEAKFVGEIGNRSDWDGSRFSLFDAYVRRRLGDLARAGISASALVAEWLVNRLAFSLSVRELDRITEANEVPGHVVTALFEAGLLDKHGDRISFAHEMFLDAFAAESTIRRSAGQIESILAALKAPVHKDRKELIIGAIDDEQSLAVLLHALTDGESIRACLSGACGRWASEWAERECGEVIESLRVEAHGVRFQRVEDKATWFEFDKGALRDWSSLERAFLTALPDLVYRSAIWAVQIIEIVGILDIRLAEEERRLRSEGSTGATLRSRLFGQAYTFPRLHGPGISEICSVMHSGVSATAIDTNLKGALNEIVTVHGLGDSLTPGQMYLVLLLCRWDEPIPGFVARAIRGRWPNLPYHLRLELLMAAHLCNPASDTDRRNLVEALEELPDQGPLLGSMVIEALHRLGALNDAEKEHEVMVREEVQRCLVDPDEYGSQHAWRVFSCQFDHPFSSTYWDVIHELPRDQQKALLSLAAQGAPPESGLVDALVVSLVSVGDLDVCDCIARFAAPPARDAVDLSNGVRAFLMSHVGLARLGCALPTSSEQIIDVAERTMAAYGALLYWGNRSDVDREGKRAACEGALELMNGVGRAVALDVLRICEGSGFRVIDGFEEGPPVAWNVLDRFGADLIDVCRHGLRHPRGQSGYFRHFFDDQRRSCLSLAMSVLARYGNSVDRQLLRTFSDDPNLGGSAVAALKVFDRRWTN